MELSKSDVLLAGAGIVLVILGIFLLLAALQPGGPGLPGRPSLPPSFGLTP